MVVGPHRMARAHALVRGRDVAAMPLGHGLLRIPQKGLSLLGDDVRDELGFLGNQPIHVISGGALDT